MVTCKESCYTTLSGNLMSYCSSSGEWVPSAPKCVNPELSWHPILLVKDENACWYPKDDPPVDGTEIVIGTGAKCFEG